MPRFSMLRLKLNSIFLGFAYLNGIGKNIHERCSCANDLTDKVIFSVRKDISKRVDVQEMCNNKLARNKHANMTYYRQGIEDTLKTIMEG